MDLAGNIVKRSFFKVLIILLLADIVFLYGCAVNKYYKKPDYNIALVKKVAVLPFENFASDKYAGEKIREKVVIELLASGFEVVEEGEVMMQLTQLKVQSASLLTLDEIKSLGQSLDVDAVIRGSVSTLGIIKGASVEYPEAALTLRMIEAENGDTVWSVSNTAGGPGFLTRHFGIEGKTLDEVAREVVKESIDTLK
ncbi:MAG: hypothetical protein Q7U10_09000 [Thermodesulfovibrionia bacterium]|nr:hypothetical protein [Thermodesulfovibrionia bacterium]